MEESKSKSLFKWKRKYSLVKDIIGSDGGVRLIGTKVRLCGQVHSIKRLQPAFIHLVDGSTPYHVQLTIPDAFDVSGVTKDSTVVASGTIVKSPKKNQLIEVLVDEFTSYGGCEAKTYKLAGYKQTREILLKVPHLRSRHRYLSAVFKVRDLLSQAVHQFYREREFMYVHTPILTSGDCEGAGEMFTVTTQDLRKKIDSKKPFKKDFFGKKVGLTVSGQLQVEAYAKSHQAVYTFGPTFRAENSHTSRHLAEFWMIEPEMITEELGDVMDLAEDFVKYCIKEVIDTPQIKFLDERTGGLIDRLKSTLEVDFKRITYTEAVELLIASKVDFEVPIKWGVELESEHEKWLTKHFEKPVIAYNYPKDFKAFYMKQNKDGRTVQSMDLLVPGIGELIGGSMREDSYKLLLERMLKDGITDLDWYLELRKYGSFPHGGFGLGFERLVMFVSGAENIRDTIPFPRYPKHADT